MSPLLLLLWLTLVILITNTRSINADNLSFNCDYGPEFSVKMHSEKDIFLDNLNKVIKKSDVNEISIVIKTLALKTDEDYLKEIVSSLPTKKTITDLNENAYNQEHPKAIQKAYQSLFNNIMDQIENSSSSLQYDLDKIKEEISSLTQQNVTKKMEKINALPTHESMKKLSNELSDIATEEDLQNIEKQIFNLCKKIQDSLAKDILNLSNLLTQEDVNGLITPFSSIISQQDVENLYTDMNLISTKESVNELFEKLVGLPKKDDLESMGIFIGNTPVVFKRDVKEVMDQMEGFASKEAVRILENSINALEIEVDAYLDELNDIIVIASQLLEDLEAQDELINTLALHFNELISSERLTDLKALLMATYSSTNATFEFVKDQEVMSPSKSLKVTNPSNDCVQTHVIEKSMGDLLDKIDSVCSKLRLQDLLLSYESKLLNKIGNLSLAVTTQKDYQGPPTVQLTSKAKRILETSSCEDSEFVGAPGNTCSVVVARNMCSTDPLMSYHCCRSCVKAKQIQEMGPHRYLQVPRRIKYNDVIWEMTLYKN